MPVQKHIRLMLGIMASNEAVIFFHSILWCKSNTLSKVIDFKDIDLYPKYWCNTINGKKTFNIRSLTIESISKQKDTLLHKKTQLVLNDEIDVDITFGHNAAKKTEPEQWVDVRIRGRFKVKKIIPDGDNDQIELVVNQSSKLSVVENG